MAMPSSERGPGPSPMLAAGLALALALLAAGLTLPIIEVRQFALFSHAFSILDAIAALAGAGELPVALLILAFSVVFPVFKILFALVAWRGLHAGRPPNRFVLGAIHASARWSMLDVFLVAIAVFALTGARFIDARIDVAAIPFALSILLSATCTWAILRRAERLGG